MSGLRMVRSYIKQNWVVYSVGIGMVAGASVLAAQIPRLLGRVTDSLHYGTLGTVEIAGYVGWIVVISAVRVSTGWGGRILVHRKGASVDLSLT